MVMSHKLDVTYTPSEDLVKIVGMGVEGVDLIKKQIHLAIIRGITKAVNMVIEYAKIIVPESHPGGQNIRPYPDTYVTEQLMNTYIDMLRLSLTMMKRGVTTLRDHYTVQQKGWDMVSYSQYVDDMQNVRWTKHTSEGNFIEKLDRRLRELIPLMIEEELAVIDKGQQLLYSGYTSSPLYPYSAGEYTSGGG